MCTLHVDARNALEVANIGAYSTSPPGAAYAESN
jgi:hypothetical protein